MNASMCSGIKLHNKLINSLHTFLSHCWCLLPVGNIFPPPAQQSFEEFFMFWELLLAMSIGLKQKFGTLMSLPKQKRGLMVFTM